MSEREHPGEETASERFDHRKAEGLPFDWSAFCSAPDYCTRPCKDCRLEALALRILRD